MCEKSVAKQNFLLEWECKDGLGCWLEMGERPCLFADMVMLKETSAPCISHSATEQKKVLVNVLGSLKLLNSPKVTSVTHVSLRVARDL